MIKNVVIWGSEQKARLFMEHTSCNVIGVVDGNDSNVGKCISEFEVCDMTRLLTWKYDAIVVCSSAYEVIVKKIEETYRDITVIIAAPEAYASYQEYERSVLNEITDKEYDQGFIDMYENANLLVTSEKIVSEINRIEKDNRRIVSCYAQSTTPMVTAAKKIWESILDKCDFEIVQHNALGFDNYVDSGMSLDFILRYNFPIDAYPLCLYLQNEFQSFQVAFDIGANRGIVSCMLAKMSRIVHSFEPSYVISEVARRNIELNRLGNIVWNECGVGEKEGILKYYDYGIIESGHNSFFKQSDWTGQECATKIVTLDEYCIEKGVEVIDILKIDTEGFEPFVIKGCRNMIEQRKIKVIVLEISPGLNKESNEDFEMLKFLLNNGFSMYNFENQLLDISDIAKISVHQDIICKL